MDRIVRETPGDANILAVCAADLRLLCRLHDREPDAGLLASLIDDDPHHWFGLRLSGAGADTGLALLQDFLLEYATASATAKAATAEDLAAEYAELYLTFGKRLSPTESFWLTEDHMERQEPMFAVRDWYTHYGVAASDWRVRADDHLVNEMEFVALLLADGRLSAVRDAGRFLDRHLLRWSREFLGGIARRAASPYFAGVALVTEAALQMVRDIVEQVSGEARQSAAEASAGNAAKLSEAPFVPGLEPGW